MPLSCLKFRRVGVPTAAGVILLMSIGLSGWFASPTPELQAQARPSEFDLSGLTIPRNELRRGGPPKDGIPAISRPRFVSPEEATYYRDDDRVVGVVFDGHARAYPLRILTQHEIVNDRLGETALAVTYCPLCDSSLVFDRRVGDREIEFGVSGLLYNSNVLMYDRRTRGGEGLWSQMKTTAVSGSQTGTVLRTVPFEITTWKTWKSRHPGTDVLSRETGFVRNYSGDPYERYFRSSQLMFPAQPPAPTERLELKEPVLGVWNQAGAKAYPLAFFRDESHPRQVEQSLGSATFRVVFDPSDESLRLEDVSGEIERAYAFWFAWYAFHPDTQVYAP